MREYCLAHPDKFEWVDGFTVPQGTMTWSSEIEKLKDCDCIHLGPISVAEGPFIGQFEDKGYTTTFIGGDGLASCRGYLVDMCGWDSLDGTLSSIWTRWWNEPYATVELADQLLNRYRPKEAEDIIYSGSGYLGGCYHAYLAFDMVRKAVEEVGAENFDGQAFYSATMNYETTLEGGQEIGFSQTSRYGVRYTSIYEWSAEAGDLVRVSDWLPVGE